MTGSLPVPANASPVDLVPPIETYRTVSLLRYLATHAKETGGVFVVVTVLIAQGAAYDEPWLVLLGVAVLSVAIAGLAVRGRNAVAVRVHEHGIVVCTRGARRVIRWREVGDLRVRLVDFKTRWGSRELDQLELFPSFGPPVRLDHSIDGLRRLIHLVEDRTSGPIGELAHASLEAGQVFSFGNLHLRKEGFVIHNETIAWRDLERFEDQGGVVWGCFASAGLHEIGRYDRISAARALMNLSAANARWEGRTVEVPSTFITVVKARDARRLL